MAVPSLAVRRDVVVSKGLNPSLDALLAAIPHFLVGSALEMNISR
jgi:hypothetical protein